MNDTPAFDFNKVRMAGVMRDIRFLGYCHGGVHLWRFPETCVSLNRVSRGTWTPGRPFDAEFHAFCPIDWEASFLKMTDSAVMRYFCTDLPPCD
jgi:hypothetical protein